MNLTAWVTIGGVIVTLLSILLTYLATKGKTQSDAKTALDARIDARVTVQLEGAWAEIDTLKTNVENLKQLDRKKTGAITRILKAIAAQWPNPHGPDLDPADIAEIEETIPPSWIRPRRT